MIERRKLWMEAHNVSVLDYGSELYDAAGVEIQKRFHVVGYLSMTCSRSICAEGDTEDEAIAAMADKMGVRLWNEDGAEPFYEDRRTLKQRIDEEKAEMRGDYLDRGQ